MKRLALLVVLAACARRSPPHATAADAERANIALAELQQGRKLLLGKCAGCHKTPMPNEHPAAEWSKLVADMAERANLDAQQRSLIEQYLVTMAPR